MKTIIATLFVSVLAGVVTWQSYGQDAESAVETPLQPVMKRKLEHAKSLIEGLATEDFDTIARNSQSLSLLSLESSWNVIVTEEYLKQSNAFRRSLESMRDAAKEQNVDRAALSYVDMTIRCVECHKYVRRSADDVVDRVGDD